MEILGFCDALAHNLSLKNVLVKHVLEELELVDLVHTIILPPKEAFSSRTDTGDFDLALLDKLSNFLEAKDFKLTENAEPVAVFVALLFDNVRRRAALFQRNFLGFYIGDVAFEAVRGVLFGREGVVSCLELPLEDKEDSTTLNWTQLFKDSVAMCEIYVDHGLIDLVQDALAHILEKSEASQRFHGLQQRQFGDLPDRPAIVTFVEDRKFTIGKASYCSGSSRIR